MEAQKCKVLERKSQDLKHAKVNLARKQKEDAAKHREITSMDCNCSMAAILALPSPSRSCLFACILCTHCCACCNKKGRRATPYIPWLLWPLEAY